MRLSSALIGTVLLAVAPTALGAEPCFPRTMRPYHVSAFATAPADNSGSGSVTAVAADPAGGELQLQADCLAWETSLSPKAELIGVVPFGAHGYSGALGPQQIPAPIKTVRVVFGTSGTPRHSSAAAANPFEATAGTGAFTLGATLIPAP